MDGLNIQMSFENLKINLKDVLQIVSFVVVAAFFFSAQSSKMEAIAETVREIKSDNEKREDKKEVYDKTMANQISTNTLQIELLKQDFKAFKERITR